MSLAPRFRKRACLLRRFAGKDEEAGVAFVRGIESDQMSRPEPKRLGRDQVVGEVSLAVPASGEGFFDRGAVLQLETISTQEVFDQVEKLFPLQRENFAQDPEQLADDYIGNKDGFFPAQRIHDHLFRELILLLVIAGEQANENIGVEGDHRLERWAAASRIASSISACDTGELLAC